MSKLTKGRVKTFPASNIPKLHTLEPPTPLPDYVTRAGSSQPRSSASIAKDMLSIDDGDFLTRRLTLTSEKGHLINAVRYDKNLAAQVAKSLVDTGIVPVELYSSFHLEHPSNLICIADGLHPLFDTYGVYAYLPSDASMDALLTVIKNRNEAWQRGIDELNPSISGQIRDFIGWMPSDVWSELTYEIALLLPEHFLPFEQELLIRDLTTPHISYIRTKVVDKELRIIPTQPDAEPIIYPPFPHSTQRSGSDRVNPFFVCINASDKYEHHCLKYGTGTMSPRVDALLQKAVMIVELVLADLEPAPNSLGAQHKTEQDTAKNKKREEEKQAKEGSRQGGSRQTRSSGLDDAVEGGQLEAIEGSESEALGSGESEGAMDDQRSDFSLDMDETGGTPDADEGLAFWDAIEEELKQPGLSPRERVRLKMLQLFGGKDYRTPHMAGVPDPPSVFDRISNVLFGDTIGLQTRLREDAPGQWADLAAAGVSVILSPARAYPETWDQRRILPGPTLSHESAVRKLMKAGVNVAIGVIHEYAARNPGFDVAWRGSKVIDEMGIFRVIER
ncbi:hypothetical protein FIBSPDRAFT_1048538 [Athelia psychrophila]|uniref:Uncharacterized protein n=1 Tax=Athelia psychrophila TaxID=1759441 RepID=A0A166DMV0_9AGAM|nr:hypothetical protein FIBSPDRAFT_1048538 [Fibularhizoctonia sp. CBS 109695]